MKTRYLALMGSAIALAKLEAQTATPPKPVAPPVPTIEWHDVTKWGLEGRAWAEKERLRWFDRFSSVAETKIPAAVWG